MDPELPYDMIVEIASRMPPRDAFQHCCLCKDLYSTLTSQYFGSLHSRNFRRKVANSWFWRYSFGNNKKAYTLIRNGRFSLLLKCHENCSREFDILGIINGVVCLPYVHRSRFQTSRSRSTIVCRIYMIILWNPVIERTLVLFPPSRPADNHLYIQSLGFAYDYTRNELKVFNIWSKNIKEEPIPGKPVLEVCLKNTEDWVKVPVQEKSCFAILNDSWAAFMEGSCHWGVYGQTKDDCWLRCFVLALDASDYSVEMYEVPDTMELNLMERTRVEVVEGCLALFPWPPFSQENEAIIWVMKEYGNGSSWVRRYRIVGEIRDIMSSDGPMLAKSGEVLYREIDGPIWDEGLEDVKLPYDGFYPHSYAESLELLGLGPPTKCFCVEDD